MTRKRYAKKTKKGKQAIPKVANRKRRREEETGPYSDTFRWQDSEEWFRTRENSGFVIERSVHPRVDELLGITQQLEKVGWTSLLQLGDHHYPDLIKELYANAYKANIKKQDGVIYSWIRGRSVNITAHQLQDTFGFMGQTPLSFNKMAITSDPDWGKQPVIEKLGLVTARGTRKRIYTSRLSPTHRVLTVLMSTNFLPRASGDNELRNVDLYLLDVLSRQEVPKDGMSLAYEIIYQIWGVILSSKSERNFVYPRMLSQLFEDLGLIGEDERKVIVPATNMITETTLSNMGFQKVDGVWRNTEVLPPQAGEIVAPPPRPDGSNHNSRSAGEDDSRESSSTQQSSTSRSDQRTSSSASRRTRQCARYSWFQRIFTMCQNIERDVHDMQQRQRAQDERLANMERSITEMRGVSERRSSS